MPWINLTVRRGTFSRETQHAVLAKLTDALMFWEKIPDTPEARKKMKGWVYEVGEESDYNGGSPHHEEPFYFIEVRLPAGRFDLLTKQHLILDFTKIIMLAEGKSHFSEDANRVWVTIVELKAEDWGIGGHTDWLRDYESALDTVGTELKTRGGFRLGYMAGTFHSTRHERVPMKKTILRTSSRFTVQGFLAMCFCLLVATLSPFAQTDTSYHHPTTDQEKIADALRAGPRFITNNATILDWPSTPGGEYRVIRKGTNEWTCLPGVPGYSHDEPGCFDATFMQWMKDSLAGREPHIQKIGIAYMYVGAWVPNKSHNGAGDDFRVGPHIMIVSPHEYQDELRPLNHDGSNEMPYVAHLPRGTDLYLVLPFRQWDEKVNDKSHH